jgi:carbonic anhydrase
VLALNLLEGVGIGLALAGLLVLRGAVRARVRTEHSVDGSRRLVAEGLLSFLSVPALSRELAAVPPGVPVRVDLNVDYLDHAARDHIDSWATRHRATGGSVEVVETRRHGRRAARRAGGSLAPLPSTVHRERRPAPAR